MTEPDTHGYYVVDFEHDLDAAANEIDRMIGANAATELERTNADLAVAIREASNARAALERVRALCDAATWRCGGVVVVSVAKVRAAAALPEDGAS